LEEKKACNVGFEVLTAVTIKSSFFWDITPCHVVKVNQRFRGTYWLHLCGRKVIQPRKKLETRSRALFAAYIYPRRKNS
jgi:hypothetical protein